MVAPGSCGAGCRSPDPAVAAECTRRKPPPEELLDDLPLEPPDEGSDEQLDDLLPEPPFVEVPEALFFRADHKRQELAPNHVHH